MLIRFCSSGLMAVSNVANQIRNGEIEIGYAVGFESMTATCVSFPFASLVSSTSKTNSSVMVWVIQAGSRRIGLRKRGLEPPRREGLCSSDG